ncbi:MAG: hypothetical protein M1817_000567 [Caeruleum heppii]|nr:MAG: hypothetical protein M1817_000567 [Caeruleum heppii]
MSFRGYGWYVSGTAVPLYLSWYLHNIIAWIKNKGFFSPWLNRAYIGTLMVVAPYWVVEMYANFAFNNNIAPLFQRTRPFEALCRDPWWIFTCCNLIFNIKTRYNFGLIPLIRTSPRFGMMLVSMAISIIFLIVDVLSTVVDLGGLVGINPYWKLSLVFKCFCDTIILDDFRSTLDKLRSVVFEGGHVTPGHRPRPRLISVSTPLGDTSASSVHVYSSNRQTPGQQSTSESILRGWNWFRRSPPDHAHHEPPIGSKEEIYVRHDVGIGHKSVRDPPGVL